uniref:KLF2 Krueppel-like factor 2 n=1 Tax=uncultured bacterium Contig1491 TaxID=1393439 RepID=W0FPE8_9BACT|nr:KLF2 Krueppel-like factor 2 [uncultured bacterium Contig1491]
MVNDSKKRRDTPLQKCHVWTTPLAEKSFVPIGHGVFVASPALCFLQAARSLSYFEHVELGYELCGAYSRTPGSGNGFINRYSQLATPKQIASLCDKLEYAPGRKAALRAIRRVLPNSKSPAETDMAIKIVFSLIEGGYGLPHPELNGEVPLTDEAAQIAGKQRVYPDVMWRKEKLCLEYESHLHHELASDRISDSIRRNALGCMGFKVITVTPSQLKSITEFDGIMSEVARHLKIRMRPTSKKTFERRFALNEAIKKRMRDDLKPTEWPYI